MVSKYFKVRNPTSPFLPQTNNFGRNGYCVIFMTGTSNSTTCKDGCQLYNKLCIVRDGGKSAWYHLYQLVCVVPKTHVAPMQISRSCIIMTWAVYGNVGHYSQVRRASANVFYETPAVICASAALEPARLKCVGNTCYILPS